MEKLFPNSNDFMPLVKAATEMLKNLDGVATHFAEAISKVNTSLYLNGFLSGVTITATVLTAIWAFSQRK
jgi:hypothetical protein